MSPSEQQLWERIKQHPLDDSASSFPFSARLARENRWSVAYTHRVILEYKRFCFLAVVAGHPVSPSESVDEAWHLHLMYTEDYWKRFCKEALERPLHHQPTKGGATETGKFDDWYRNTLSSYRKFFQQEPPGDIWPTPEEKLKAKHDFVHVDSARTGLSESQRASTSLLPPQHWWS